jgi:hypothetical protein
MLNNTGKDDLRPFKKGRPFVKIYSLEVKGKINAPYTTNTFLLIR